MKIRQKVVALLYIKFVLHMKTLLKSFLSFLQLIQVAKN
jgi:hypothetical protein